MNNSYYELVLSEKFVKSIQDKINLTLLDRTVNVENISSLSSDEIKLIMQSTLDEFISYSE